MNSLTDQQLLRDYTGRRSEAAFAELVRRHVDLVYSAALRMVRDAHLAEDVAQGVFVALAQNARQLTDHPVLSGWLHRTTQNLATKAVRSDVRRRAREQEAAAMNELLSAEPETVWEHIAPHLDEALGELNEGDRDALLLRYFERKSAREMAQTLGTSEDAAQKRVSRAVERLREFFAKRGITVGAGGLVVVITANAVQAAPVGLAATIATAAALAGTAIPATATATATKAIVMTTLQKTLITATLIAAVGTGIYEARQASTLRSQVQTLQQQQAPLAEQIQQLSKDRDDAARQLAVLRDENQRLSRSTTELVRLRGEVTQLKAATISEENDATASAMKSWLSRARRLKQVLEQMPEKKIPELQFITETDWLETVRSVNMDTEIETRQALKALRNTAKEKVASLMSEALRRYLKANDGRFPADTAQLKPYFEAPMDDAILERYTVLPATDVTNGGLAERGPQWLIAEKAPVDVDYDTRFVIGAFARGKTDFDADILIPVVRAFQTANNGQQLGDPSRLLPFAKTPEQQRALQKWIQRFPDLQREYLPKN